MEEDITLQLDTKSIDPKPHNPATRRPKFQPTVASIDQHPVPKASQVSPIKIQSNSIRSSFSEIGTVNTDTSTPSQGPIKHQRIRSKKT